MRSAKRMPMRLAQIWMTELDFNVEGGTLKSVPKSQPDVLCT